jgi:hypothetical protein
MCNIFNTHAHTHTHTHTPIQIYSLEAETEDGESYASAADARNHKWSPMGICEAFARKKSFLTKVSIRLCILSH